MTKSWLSVMQPAVLFSIAALLALVLAIQPWTKPGPLVDLYFHDTYFVVSGSHLALSAGLLSLVYAGVYWLFPRFFGRNLSAFMGELHFWLSLLAILAIVISSFKMAHQFQAAARTIAVAMVIFLLAQGIFVVNFVWTLLR